MKVIPEILIIQSLYDKWQNEWLNVNDTGIILRDLVRQGVSVFGMNHDEHAYTRTSSKTWGLVEDSVVNFLEGTFVSKIG